MIAQYRMPAGKRKCCHWVCVCVCSARDDKYPTHEASANKKYSPTCICVERDVSLHEMSFSTAPKLKLEVKHRILLIKIDLVNTTHVLISGTLHHLTPLVFLRYGGNVTNTMNYITVEAVCGIIFECIIERKSLVYALRYI